MAVRPLLTALTLQQYADLHPASNEEMGAAMKFQAPAICSLQAITDVWSTSATSLSGGNRAL